jgi:TetR/AcrR family transcriptional regulator, mexCD-oprJ operon repressor
MSAAEAGTGVSEHDGRRAIGERNAQAILDAALLVLAKRPDAGIGEIAAAAGLGRATVYRHFPVREDLLGALRERAREEMRSVIRAACVAGDDAEAALRRLVAALVELGDRYRVLAASDDAGRARQLPAVVRPLREAIERGQRDGLIDPELPPSWIVAALLALLRAAKAERRGPGTADAVVDLLLDGVRAP